jgi:hypothetical protein
MRLVSKYFLHFILFLRQLFRIITPFVKRTKDGNVNIVTDVFYVCMMMQLLDTVAQGWVDCRTTNYLLYGTN